MAGKILKKAYEGLDSTKSYSVEEALSVLKAAAKNRKFVETVEISFNLGIDPRHADQIVRGMFEFPNGTGKTMRVAVFAKDDKAKEALAAGADVVGTDDLAEKILAGQIDFERVIATPDMMPLVGRLGKVLGPKGMMPNPKLGTVTMDVKKAVESAKGGAIEYRAEKNGIVHAGVGKIDFADDKLLENIKALYAEIARVKPSGARGNYMKKVSLSSTMGPGLRIDLSSLAA
jgi:large subunit ribosomal protein L1